MQRKALLTVIIIFLTSLLGVFAVGSKVEAKLAPNESSACPDPCTLVGKSPRPVWNKTDTNPIKYIRLQIYIPGVTETCTYEIKEIGKEELTKKKCHYIASSLPAYIKRLYSFSIGVIAIIAVVMIMIGGLKWIFAAGSSAKIGEARQQITAAVAGLILALCSYVLLNAINPSLIKLTPIDPTNVETIEQATRWCKDLRADMMIKEKGKAENGYNLMHEGECGKQYEIKDTKNREGAGLMTCWGSNCSEIGDGSGICFLVTSSNPRCFEPRELCESMGKDECDSINKSLSVHLQSCRKYRRENWFDADCKWGDVWPIMNGIIKYKNTQGINEGADHYRRISCDSYKECIDDKHCSNDHYANIVADNICALNLDDGIKCQADNPNDRKYSEVSCNHTKSKQACTEKCWARVRVLYRGGNRYTIDSATRSF